MKKLVCLLSLFIVPAWAGAQLLPTLHLFSGREVLPDSLVSRFEQHCRCLVEHVIYEDNEEMVSRVAHGAPVDVLFTPGLAMPELIRRRLLSPLDKPVLPDISNLNPLMGNPSYDPGNTYSLPVSMSLASVGYNIEKLRELNVDPYSWSVIFDPKVLARLKGHVNVVDNPRTVYAAALMYLGLDPNSTSDEDYQRASDVIAAARPFWSGFGGNYYWRDLVSGEAWVQLGYSKDFYLAREAAKNEHRAYTIGNVLQREGNQLVIVSVAVPAAAPHPDLAQRFIDFLFAGKNAAEFGNVFGATPSVISAGPFLQDNLKYHPIVNPDPEAIRKWTVLRELPPRRMHYLRRMWHELRSDRMLEQLPPAPAKESAATGSHSNSRNR